jgi:hypothetical protein
MNGLVREQASKGQARAVRQLRRNLGGTALVLQPLSPTGWRGSANESQSIGEKDMLKRTLLAAAVIGLLGLAMPVHAATVTTGTSCRDAAKAQFPDDRSARVAFRKQCKAAWKASQGKTGWLLKKPAA